MERHDRARRGGGVTLAELLVVVAVVAMAVAVAVPLIAGAVRSANARAAANAFSVNLKAARMLAVTTNASVPFVVRAEPHPRCSCTATFYEYPGRTGQVRRFEMPPGVSIATSTSPITFLPNGAVGAPSTTVIRAEIMPDNVELWTIETSLTGVPSVRHERERP